MLKKNKLVIPRVIAFALSAFILGGASPQYNCKGVAAKEVATTQDAASVGHAVKLTADTDRMTATMSNEYITVKFNKTGTGYSLVKNGQELIGMAKGFYSSVDAKLEFAPTSLKVVTDTPDMADIAYISSWGELHYVIKSGLSGVYSYFVASNLGKVGEFRTVYRVDGNIFRNGYTSVKSGPLPSITNVANSTKLQDETFGFPDGTVYSKYDWADYEARDDVHGLYGNGYGIWVVPVSHEYYNSGPMRQELMLHLESSTGDGVLLNMLKGSHFGVGDVDIPSNKFYGPWLIYVNNGDISDAKVQASKEEKEWPYKWVNSDYYPLSRTNVTGKLNIAGGKSAEGATVVLAKPGSDFYTQGQDYIFYSKADANGNFTLPNVRPGTYTFYAYATNGDITDEFHKDNINVTGSTLDLGNLNWTPTTHANSLWKIGTANRLSSEFKFGDLQRQYGLPEKVPANLTYTIGTSTEANDWYFAQTKVGTWDVNFNLDKTYSTNAYLTIATAGVARNPKLDLYVNGKIAGTLDYSDQNDASIYRGANQSGRYRNAVIKFPANLLKAGNNTISFKMSNVGFDGGIMYDIIKLETD
jgi:rhamnogalacturonan endolyase